MYGAPPVIETTVYTALPKELHNTDKKSAWTQARPWAPRHSFLEGPSFDRAGNLYCTDIPYGRIFRISPDRKWEVFAEYDGEPNGLKIHSDGRIFVADHKLGLLVFDPNTGKHEVLINRPLHEGFKGLNDLVFASNGDLYFTDQGQSSLDDPTGRVYRLRANGELDLLYKGLASPNGLVLSTDEKLLYVNVTRSNCIVSMPLVSGKGVSRSSLFIQLSGSPVGPDGLAIDEEGNLAVVHAGLGTVWVFSRLGEPIYRIKSCAGLRTTNLAFGGDDRRTLFITEGEHGVILQAKLPTPGKLMYSHS